MVPTEVSRVRGRHGSTTPKRSAKPVRPFSGGLSVGATLLRFGIGHGSAGLADILASGPPQSATSIYDNQDSDPRLPEAIPLSPAVANRRAKPHL